MIWWNRLWKNTQNSLITISINPIITKAHAGVTSSDQADTLCINLYCIHCICCCSISKSSVFLCIITPLLTCSLKGLHNLNIMPQAIQHTTYSLGALYLVIRRRLNYHGYLVYSPAGMTLATSDHSSCNALANRETCTALYVEYHYYQFVVYSGDASNHVFSWWRHEMETFSALLAICAGN